MNKLIVFGLLALIINTIYATYSFSYCEKFLDFEKELKGLADSDDFEEICSIFKTTVDFNDFTHCCFVKETKNDTISSRCVQITDDQYENIKKFKKYIIDENGDDDFEIDCSSKFVALSLFAVLAILF